MAASAAFSVSTAADFFSLLFKRKIDAFTMKNHQGKIQEFVVFVRTLQKKLQQI